MNHLRPVWVWVAFGIVHAVLIIENLVAPNSPLGDVQFTYPAWWLAALTSGEFPGLTTTGVYPYLALIPIALATEGVAVWFLVVVILDALAVAVLLRCSVTAAVAWLGFQLALGPIALGRIDAVTVALAVMAVALMDKSPRVAGGLVAIATWVKVWPVALGIAALRSSRFAVFARWSIGIAVAFAAVGIALGDRMSVFSFISQQQGRGIQVEAVAATPWLWDAWNTGQSTVAYSPSIFTFEIMGPGTEIVASALTVVQVLVLSAVVLMLVAHRRSITEGPAISFGYALLVIVTLLIVTNKVGSPQFVAWLAVPLVAIVMLKPTRATTILVSLIGAIAVLTHIVYPYVYFAFLELRTVPLVLVTVRNLAEIALLPTAAVVLVTQLRVEKLAKQFADLGISDQKGVVSER
jgi:hypothetical protein